MKCSACGALDRFTYPSPITGKVQNWYRHLDGGRCADREACERRALERRERVRWECPKCGKRYDDDGLPPMTATPTCSGGKRHKQTNMRKRDQYQCDLDDLGIAADDPLRFA